MIITQIARLQVVSLKFQYLMIKNGNKKLTLNPVKLNIGENFEFKSKFACFCKLKIVLKTISLQVSQR